MPTQGTTKERGYGWSYQQARRALLADHPLCDHCGRRPATEADHQPPLALHAHVDGSRCCDLVPSCWRCRQEQAAALSAMLRARPKPEAVVEPAGYGPRDPVWNVPWLKGLRRVPKDATWPRLMTVPHPRAVGSLGAEVAKWAEVRRGRPWRWWQKLYATRLLEVDAAGELVWETTLLTLARQLGKTWFLHDICSWRLEQGARFGAAQEVVSIAKDLSVSRKMQQPARARAKSMPDMYRVREVNGQEEIEVLADGSRWMIRSKDGVYGLTASMATVDEAWKVAASVIDDGLVPTMIEQPQSQLLLISTAHRRATALMIGRRLGALERLGNPDSEGGTLLIEWSAPPDAELDDRAGWRLASPHWTPKRERWIAERLAAAQAGESDDIDEPDPLESFQTQWLNRWPAKRLNVQKGEPLIDGDVWDAAVSVDDTAGPLWIGVEDHFERGAAVAFCGLLPDGRWVIGGELCQTRADAYQIANAAAVDRPGSTIVVGASLADDIELAAMPAYEIRKAGAVETGPALSTLRELIADRVAHDDSPDLAQQVAMARVTVGATGIQHLVPGARSDLLRAAVWALQAAVTAPAPVPSIH